MRKIAGIVALLSFSLTAPAQWHSIDTTPPLGVISLFELTRAIQLYNSSGFHCQASTEDGYAPGSGDQSCAPNNLDYNPQNWSISLSELLRAIQFYNSSSYYPCPGQSTEDRFCPVAPSEGEGEGEGEGDGEGEASAMLSIAASSFQMGDPFNEGHSDELPVHTVYLDAYEIGQYDVTNQQYADVLNWAYSRGELTNSNGGAYRQGQVYSHGQLIASTRAGSAFSSIEFNAGTFTVLSRTGTGAQSFSMARHPVVTVSWYGAVAFCNWRSEMDGLQPCYDFTDWSRYSPVRYGYRLPTEAEWERAAAWDGSRHWRYAFTSDTIDFTRANYNNGSTYANPFGLTTTTSPYTSPVGWFNGVNVSSNGNVQTVNSPSPVGSYDMCGNVWQWCEDRYASTYYANSPRNNPPGAASGNYRVMRGWPYGYVYPVDPRAACRFAEPPNSYVAGCVGMRVARTP